MASCKPGRIPGVSEGLTTSTSLSESSQLFQTGLSVTLPHSDIHTDLAPKASRESRGREYGDTCDRHSTCTIQLELIYIIL